MRLESVGLAISGSMLLLMGKAFERDVDYQATFDLTEELTVMPDNVVFVERFGKVAERHSTIELLANG